MEIKAVFIKQIHFGKLIFNEGDLVKVTLKDECRKGCHILPKEYTGILSQISDSFCCVREGKLATPIEYEEIKSIETASSDNAEDEDYDFEETCPHCDHSNKVKWDKKSHTFICECCGERILLCSLCNMDEQQCGKCPYEKELHG